MCKYARLNRKLSRNDLELFGLFTLRIKLTKLRQNITNSLNDEISSLRLAKKTLIIFFILTNTFILQLFKNLMTFLSISLHLFQPFH